MDLEFGGAILMANALAGNLEYEIENLCAPDFPGFGGQ